VAISFVRSLDESRDDDGDVLLIQQPSHEAFPGRTF
jgi:hypothetical protein